MPIDHNAPKDLGWTERAVFELDTEQASLDKRLTKLEEVPADKQTAKILADQAKQIGDLSDRLKKLEAAPKPEAAPKADTGKGEPK